MDEQNKLELENAFELYRQRPDVCTGKQLRKAVCSYLSFHPYDVSRYGPSLAMLITLLERKHLAADGFKTRFGIRFLLWALERGLGTPVPPRRPDWNDYYMVRWQLTHEQRWANEIHRRTHYTDAHMVGWTANWMVAYQRREDEEFNRAMSVAEVECGCSVGAN